MAGNCQRDQIRLRLNRPAQDGLPGPTRRRTGRTRRTKLKRSFSSGASASLSETWSGASLKSVITRRSTPPVEIAPYCVGGDSCTNQTATTTGRSYRQFTRKFLRRARCSGVGGWTTTRPHPCPELRLTPLWHQPFAEPVYRLRHDPVCEDCRCDPRAHSPTEMESRPAALAFQSRSFTLVQTAGPSARCLLMSGWLIT